MSDQQEKRIYTVSDLEVRGASEDEPAVIVGHAAVFNERSVDLGGFVEQIEPGAFSKTLAAKPDVRATVDHEGGMTTLGRTKSGTLHLDEDERGLRVMIIPPDTQAGRDAVTLLKRGDIDQMSFMFRVPPGGDKWEKLGEGMMLRTLRQVDLDDGDVSIVTYPAYPQTSVEARAKLRELASQEAEAGDSGADEGGGSRARRAHRQRKLKITKLKMENK